MGAQDEAGGNCLAPCLKLISSHRGSVRDAKVLQHRQGKTILEKWSLNSQSSTDSWSVHASSSPWSFFAPCGEERSICCLPSAA